MARPYWSKLITRLQIYFLSACTATIALAGLAETGQTGSEWILKQKAEDSGDHTVYVSPDAVKIVCHTMGYEILAKGPDWQIHCYRPATKEFWLGNLDQFNGIIMRNPFALPQINSKAIDTAGSTTYQGLKCTRYWNNATHRPIIYGADDIAASDKACEVICRYYYTHKLKKVPLYRLLRAMGTKSTPGDKGWLDADLAKDLRNGDRIALITQSAKKIPFNAQDFDFPKNYKRVKEINQVSYPPERKADLGALIDDLGFTPQDKVKPTPTRR